ncbi:unnamed protein product, partial [Polarella glacialis]
AREHAGRHPPHADLRLRPRPDRVAGVKCRRRGLQLWAGLSGRGAVHLHAGLRNLRKRCDLAIQQRQERLPGHRLCGIYRPYHPHSNRRLLNQPYSVLRTRRHQRPEALWGLRCRPERPVDLL